MSDIKVDLDGPVATVTMNRPEQRNAVTYAMWQELARTFHDLAHDPQVLAIILTGAGTDFSTGADVNEFGAVRSGSADSRRYEVAVDAAAEAIFDIAKPTIAALHGHCLGGAAHLAMCCDFRVAASGAMFGVPAARLSIVYGVSATRKLASLVGISEAKRILYTAELFDADRALATGFIDAVADDPVTDARLMAKGLCKSAPLTIGGAKFILNGCARQALDAGEADALIDRASDSYDYVEGRRAFHEKRTPHFLGQ
jgi:enoyl-CoA hydratase/carnithine racemase